MTIFAMKGSSDWCNILESLKKGEGRFGWSYVNTANLKELGEKVTQRGWDSLSEEEKDCYQNFLLELKPDDYVVYVNIPEWGKCTTAKVTGGYFWRFDDDDFNHRFSVDPSTVFVFDRNDSIVHPVLKARLKLQRRWWRIYFEEEFESLVNSLSSGIIPTPADQNTGLKFLANEIQPFLVSIANSVQRTHPNYDLEGLVARTFQNVPGVMDVKWQGGAGDHGADVLVTYNEGLPLPGLENQGMMVVQVKSYEGEHWDTQAVEDLKRAFMHYPEAKMGLIISTSNSMTKDVEKALDELREVIKKPIAMMLGPEVAAFFLKYGPKLA